MSVIYSSIHSNVSLASPPEIYQMLPEPWQSQALWYSFDNLNRELEGQSMGNPEYIDGQCLSLPLLYCLHVEHYGHQPNEFNIHQFRGWQYCDMIITLAKKERCHLYEAWRQLMRTRFQIQDSENSQVVDLTKGREVVDLTGED
jgi:hypothetical protein